MKKTILLFASIAALSIACSTKKDYKCTCTLTSGGSTVGTSSTIINDTKDNATTKCSNLSQTATNGGISVTSSCAIE